MSSNYCEECQHYYLGNLVAKFGEPVGATETQIRKFEADRQIKLPKAYRQFLRWMGDDRHGVFKGSEWFLSDIDLNNELLPELLHENSVAVDLSDQYICFFSHQGYMAAWFFLSDNLENPICYFFSETVGGDASVSTCHFDEFVLSELQHAVAS